MRDHVVCRLDELPPGTMRLVELGKFGIGVYNVDGALHAIANFCPHEGAPVCLGRLQGRAESRPDLPGGTGYSSEGRILRCPWHQWEFDITTGKTLTQPERSLRTYPVRVEAGEVIVTQ